MKNLHTFEEFLNENINEFGPLAGSGNSRANDLDNKKLEAAKKSEKGDIVYVVGGKYGSYKLSKYFEKGNTYAAYYNGIPHVVEGSFVNEATITPMQMEMKGKTLINKISIGAKFIGDLNNKPETLTVIGFGDRANAFKIFEVETSDGTKTYLKVTVMYGCNYRVMDNPRGNWDAAKTFNLKSIIE